MSQREWNKELAEQFLRVSGIDDARFWELVDLCFIDKLNHEGLSHELFIKHGMAIETDDRYVMTQLGEAFVYMVRQRMYRVEKRAKQKGRNWPLAREPERPVAHIMSGRPDTGNPVDSTHRVK